MHSRLYRNLQLLITSYLSGSIERINFFREFHLSEGLQEFLGLENLPEPAREVFKPKGSRRLKFKWIPTL